MYIVARDRGKKGVNFPIVLTDDENAKHPAKDHHVAKTCIHVPTTLEPRNMRRTGNDTEVYRANSSTFHEALILD